ncbi:dihydroneopterin triphosphate pyrophosphatase [Ruminiclostridium hungatei]|uniref:Dihydroneopterin triphosphate pyrophosphatase n=2 Tax=Ruminiclostridium hungatei TaxID=48256 RepID=A0A1V4SQ15_RUMHU|nr:dihydroneopterin triphosphate pyrophosphatase [Ruminiclostridium hungatei]
MEFGESAEETVIREVSEETGLTIKPVKLLDTWNSVKEDYQITGIIYSCIIEKGEVRLSAEHDRYEWLNADATEIDKLHKVFREKMVNWDWNKLL